MSNKTKILSELSKIAVDAMSTFSGLKKEIEIIVKLKVEKAINKMNLVRRDEFEALKKVVQKLASKRKNLENKLKKNSPKSRKKKKKKISK
tara:strand:+ start:190 stop:462 length:273 start_codon:yes stop_codon:yes gene_type:complete